MDALLLGSSTGGLSLFISGKSSWRSKDLKAVHFPNVAKRQNQKQRVKGSAIRVQVPTNKSYNLIGNFYTQRIQHCARGILETSTVFQKSNTKFLVNATSGHPLESEPKAYPNTPWNSAKNALDAFYRFSRPHTVIGTALSIISVSLLSVEKLSDISPLFFTGVLEVNKPYLPLASGEYSALTGIMIVTSFSIMSFWLGWIIGSWPLFWALFVSFVLGTAYSINLPLLRWKRFALVAAMCILAVRAVIVQLAFYLHIQTHVFSRPAVISKPLIFATAFMSFFSVVIALFKDIPDIEGDKIFGIKSYTVRLGQEKVFWTCISLLEMAYGISILVGATSPYTWSKVITVLGHSVLASILWIRAKSVDLKSKAAITSCYMFIWKLFYAEYFLIPLIR
ncbi:homogentisate phytyltransferase 1, chloroplastic isoform X4 [Gossypium arboreum]|uniref:homogentisate phytyltransferase 1, chloroplastic isoform X4 n=1 Tax=Gossypium arboreum TaxID=29729 RepID=UPI0022F1C66B|nr:homogentisate phytyltransferase 1, chloroplastic isoform X4 [Gossypium arboreum]